MKMKKRMKQFGSLVIALTMALSLSVTALAGGNALPAAQTDSASTVTSQGALPADITDVVLPYAPATGGTGLFSMIFDTHGMIYETKGDRYQTANDGKGVATPDDSRFFFKNYTNTAVDTTDKLAADGEGMKKDDEVVVFKEAAATGGLTSIYAQVDTNGKLVKWLDSTGNEPAATAWQSGGAYEKIAKLEKLDPASGYGLDAIDDLNANNPSLYLHKVGTVSGNSVSDLNDTEEYSFIGAYDDTAPVYVAFDDSNAFSKAFSALAPTAISGAASTDLSNYAGVTAAKFEANSKTYYRQREVKAILSLKKTSSDVVVINKTNADIGVSMKAELSGLPGGDGKLDANNKQTYVYAPVYNATSGKFFDGPESETTTKEITGVPTLYLTLTAEDNANALDNTATNTVTTEVMSYSATDSKATVSIGTTIAGQDTFFEKKWEGANADTGKYVYQLKDSSYDKRQADFHAMTFRFEGVIDKDDEVWDGLNTAPPTVSITWGVESFKPLKAPTVDKPTSIMATKPVVFNVSDNPDNAILVKITQGGTEIASDKITITNDATTGGTTSISVAKGVITGTADIVFKFQDQTKDFRTKDVTLEYAAPSP